MSARWWIATDMNLSVWTVGRSFASASYARWQVETCPTTSRRHIQAVVYFPNKVRLGTVRKEVSDTAHWETVKDPAGAVLYCGKEETRFEGPYEFGNNPLLARKKRKQDLDFTRPLKELVLDNPFRAKQLKEAKGILVSPRHKSCTGLWLEGCTGTGKSKISHLIGSYLGDYYVKDSTKWWDCYDAEKLVLLDDYRGEWSAQELLTTIDRYPKRVEYKGGYSQLKAEYVIITSNKSLEECYLNVDKKTLDALKRRIKSYVVY